MIYNNLCILREIPESTRRGLLWAMFLQKLEALAVVTDEASIEEIKKEN